MDDVEDDAEREGEALLRQFSHMSQQIVTKNQSLRKEVARLQQAVEAYKDLALKKDTEIKALKREALLSETNRGQNLVFVLIDGDGAIFDIELVKRGREGGKDAAQLLWQNIKTYCESNTLTSERSNAFIIQIFLNQSGLSKTLTERNLAANDTFTNFVRGFNEASPSLIMTDCGMQKEAADSKIKELLRIYLNIPQYRLVLLGGVCHDGGYAHILSALRTEALSDKVVLLKSYAEMTFEISNLRFQSTEFPGVFLQEKLPVNCRSPPVSQFNTPAPVASSLLPAMQNSPPRFSSVSNGISSAAPTPPVQATPYKRHSKKPCYYHHILDACKHGPAKCSYAHDPLSPEELDKLREYGVKHKLPQPHPPTPPPTSFDVRNKHCYYYHVKGECRNGNHCKFSHGPISREDFDQLRIRSSPKRKTVSLPRSSSRHNILGETSSSGVNGDGRNDDESALGLSGMSTPGARTLAWVPRSSFSAPPITNWEIDDAALKTFTPLLSSISRHSSSNYAVDGQQQRDQQRGRGSALWSRLGTDDWLSRSWRALGFDSLKSYISAAQDAKVVLSTSVSGPGSERVVALVDLPSLGDSDWRNSGYYKKETDNHSI